jgi:tetratricopeptide (TPR) repeat protein
MMLFVSTVSSQERPVPFDPLRPWIAEADSLAAVGQLEAALRQYARLADLHGDDAQLWLRIAVLRLQFDLPGAALEAARTATSLAPDEVDVAVVLAQAQSANGDAAAGIATLEAALATHPEDPELLETVATVAVNTGQWAKATGVLRQLVRLRPQRMLYRYDLIRILQSRNQLAEASELLHETLDAGGDPRLCHALAGKGALLAGDADAAERAYLKSLELGENSEALGGMGAVQFVRGKPREAVRYFRKALELRPRDPDLLFNLGNALAQSDRPAEAEQAYRSSLEADPFSAATYQNLGVLLLGRLRPIEAQTAFQRALEIEPQEPAPYLHMARTRAALFDFAGALQNYRQYHDRIDDATESARIATVMEDLRVRLKASRDAIARGEIHLLQLMVETREEAARLLDRSRAGEDFYTLAHTFSQLAEKVGIDAGFVDPASLNEAFAPALRHLKPQECTPVLEGPNGFYIFQRVE